MTNLLPPNATANEIAMHDAVMQAMPADRFDEIADYKNPQRCPAYLLPLLAWERGVDEWDHNWDETIKRDVIDAAPESQAHSGTLQGLKEALKAMGVSIDITEAWQTGDVPHTFNLHANISSILTNDTAILSDELFNLIHRKAKRAKNVRSTYTLSAGIQFAARSLAVGTNLGCNQVCMATSTATINTTQNASLGFLSSLSSFQFAFITMETTQ